MICRMETLTAAVFGAAALKQVEQENNQTFNTVAFIQYGTFHEFVTIMLRLGGAVAQDIRPLVPQPLANPVPPPLT
jgi:hypothetical protein